MSSYIKYLKFGLAGDFTVMCIEACRLRRRPRTGRALATGAARAPDHTCDMKRLFQRIKQKITLKELPPPYSVDDTETREQYVQPNTPACEVLDLLANCKLLDEVDSPVEYEEIIEMGLFHSTPLAHRHKSKISLTWVLKENLDKLPEKEYANRTKSSDDKQIYNHENESFSNFRKCKSNVRDRVVGRNEYYHNLRFRSACEEFVNGGSDTDDDSCVTEEYRRRHRHRHRRKKKKRRSERFGYDIRDLDSFLSEATIDRPGNIPVVIAYPTTLYQTQKGCQSEVPLPLGTVVNAVFKNEHWLYAQTPHGDEGYVLYAACLPLGILPNRTSPKNTPCWESSTDIYPRPCGNLTDTEKEQLRTRSRSETRAKRKTRNACAEKHFDTLYLKTKSICSIDSMAKSSVSYSGTKRQTLLVVTSDYTGCALNRTVSVCKGEVVGMVRGVNESDVDAEWFYVRKKDGSQGFIPADVAGHGYI